MSAPHTPEVAALIDRIEDAACRRQIVWSTYERDQSVANTLAMSNATQAHQAAVLALVTELTDGAA